MYALLFPFEWERFQQNIPGRWEEVEDYPPITLLRLQPDEPVATLQRIPPTRRITSGVASSFFARPPT